MTTETTMDDRLNKWEKIQFAYDIWFETLAPKYKIGETIYTQIKTMLECIVDDFKQAEQQKTAPLLARISALENVRNVQAEVMLANNQNYQKAVEEIESLKKQLEEKDREIERLKAHIYELEIGNNL